MPYVRIFGRPHGGTPTNYIIRFVWRISRGRSGTPVKCSTHFAIFRVICAVCSYIWDVEVADCRWQSFCDLTESADENRPLHRQRSLCLLEFYHDKIHRLRCGVSSSQKISGTTLIFRDPCFIKIKIIFPSPPR